MSHSSSFVIRIAQLCIEICGANDEDSLCLQELKRVFCHHEVSEAPSVDHRIVVRNTGEFVVPPEASLLWKSPYLGVASSKRERRSMLSRIFARNKEIPLYTGTCNVKCYKDSQADFFLPEDSRWLVEHHAKEHITYVYSAMRRDSSDGLPAMLINLIGSQYGFYLLFASGVAVDGRAILFTGDSGVGKSTLCLELIQQGASYIGDDLVLVYQKGEQAMVGSLLFSLKHYADRGDTHKKIIDAVSLMSGQPSLNVPLSSVYLLQRNTSESDAPKLRQMESATMLEYLLKFSNRANTTANGKLFLDTLSRICETVPCYYLSFGNLKSITPSFFDVYDRR